VFFPAFEHQAIVAEKKRLLAAVGLEGVDPLDAEQDRVIEDFDLADNLMIECGLADSGGQLLLGQDGARDRFFDSALFYRCGFIMAEILRKS
jgi:hypothetical protein